ncbi:YceI family protein [Polaribacter gangjinensis]|uniref:Lipid/polyisoprenoid-binding YceI-like domain-containing protein n=1 Tax=Polaribacter gangjinensis TaxID=574710 RepID=A0A2S7W8B9_9FLAO|nr:YceI family protein [Polaribacter gangjinensis]PQJ73859.1 hypothetical protein BTO13_00565 [Polaribacter gangjinensis]
MKKIIATIFLGILIISTAISCKSESKKDSSDDSEKIAAPFAIKYAKNEINFTAYKTTEKIPVGGQFSKVDIVSGGTGNSVKEAVHNTQFSIPVSSLLTKDSSRDYKIKKFFFGVMNNTELLSGKLIISDDSNGIAKITMNGETQDVPFTYTIVDKTFNMQASIDINNWNASAALASLNKVCEDLHKGSDGVSVTWSEVALNITSTFN